MKWDHLFIDQITFFDKPTIRVINWVLVSPNSVFSRGKLVKNFSRGKLVKILVLSIIGVN